MKQKDMDEINKIIDGKIELAISKQKEIMDKEYMQTMAEMSSHIKTIGQNLSRYRFETEANLSAKLKKKQEEWDQSLRIIRETARSAVESAASLERNLTDLKYKFETMQMRK